MGLIVTAIIIFAIGWIFFKTFSDNPIKKKLAAKRLELERQLGEVFVLENLFSFFLSFLW